MHRLLLLALLIPCAAHAQNPDQPVASRIEQVTVYREGARVERFAEARLRPGTTDLVFGGLPPGLGPEDIEVQADGAFTLLGVTTRRDYADTTGMAPEVGRLRGRIAVLDDSLAALRMRMEVLAQEQQLLSANQNLGPNATVAEIRSAAEFYRERLTEIKMLEYTLRKRLEALAAERARVEGQSGEMMGRRVGNVPSAIVATVSAAQAGDARFRLRYVVGGASWQPRYDARVRALDLPVDLTLSAAVEQHTGEDWSNVRLTLSTGDPSARSIQPMLAPWYLAYPVYRAFRQPSAQAQRGRVSYGPTASSPETISGTVRNAGDGTPIPGANVLISGTAIGTATNIDGTYHLELPPQTRGSVTVASIGYEPLHAALVSKRIDFYLAEEQVHLDEVVVMAGVGRPGRSRSAETEIASMPPVEQMERATTVEYVVNTPFSLPSDGRERVVEAQRFSLPATYTYYAAPRLDPSAYLTARIPDWHTHSLQPGDVSLFLESAFVGTTFLDASTADDTLTLSLGRDAGVVVRRTQVDAQRKRSFFGSRVEESRGYRIEVRNTRTRPVEVVVEDQIPLSGDGDISVTHDIGGGGSLDEGTGIVRWTRTLAPGESATMSFSYRVRYPRSRSLRVD